MVRAVFASIAMLVVSPVARGADVTVADVTFDTCAEGTAAVVKGEACYIQDVVRGGSRWQLTMKFGLFVEYTAGAGTGAGAGASTAFVVTLSIPAAKAHSADDARRYVQDHTNEVAKTIAAALKSKAGKAAPAERDLLRILAHPHEQMCSMSDAEFEELMTANSCSLRD